ncbi:MAG: redoxin domain-containing protein [Nitrospinaceae bacterium]|nr:TlpA family protein disulfide reductase [Nitrospinaceae bacterium]NIR56867.1 TlpA family protein disulfide reductase [Nitrospinaceae bacterium]NIS87333.1 TlpA family protein disulfide reductase [Nitrospinaceae bacterium]NIT84187.1 TlpA family protein disulfide reductase [Nitrospinaceae bacterium]NIU46373.1 TlpA family protein disulfide reductase [Nitrospinaceae bacterium]
MDFKFFLHARWVWILFFSLFLLGMAAHPPLVGGPAPPFQLKDTGGQTVKLSDMQEGIVILNFWATWCVPCVREMPEFQKTHESLKGRVRIVAINLAESKGQVEEFIKNHQLSFPVLLDDYGNVSQKYEVVNLPVTYFITPDGIIREKIFGGGLTRKVIEGKVIQLEKLIQPDHANNS